MRIKNRSALLVDGDAAARRVVLDVVEATLAALDGYRDAKITVQSLARPANVLLVERQIQPQLVPQLLDKHGILHRPEHDPHRAAGGQVDEQKDHHTGDDQCWNRQYQSLQDVNTQRRLRNFEERRGERYFPRPVRSEMPSR